MIAIGRVSTVYGIKGWVKIFSHTSPMENIFSYQPWVLVNEAGTVLDLKVASWKKHGKGLVAQFEGYADRNQAMQLNGIEIRVDESAIPPAADNEIYWRDLIGMAVINQQGERLGLIKTLLETGANDVLVVKGCKDSIDRKERLIPWVPEQYVDSIDTQTKQVTVDWQSDWDD